MESLFYQSKEENQIIKYRESLELLPTYIRDYLISKEMITKYSTLIAYAYDLKNFLTYLKTNNPALNNVSIKDISVDVLDKLNECDIEEYQRYLRFSINGTFKTQNSNKAIARKMTSIRGLFMYLEQRKYINRNVAIMVSLPKIKESKVITRLDNSETHNEIKMLLDGISSIESLNIPDKQMKFLQKSWMRDRAILNLLLGTGIRVSECEGLDLTDINFSNNCLNIKRKGGFYDNVYFNDMVAIYLKDYIECERLSYSSAISDEIDKNALFISNKSKRMSVDAIENMVAKYTQIILGKRYTPHKLRATYGTVLYQKTGDIRLTADVLGHSSVTTTSKHYAAQTEQNKIKAGLIEFD